MVGDTATAMSTDTLAATVPKPDPTSGVQLELAAQVQRLETALSVSKARVPRLFLAPFRYHVISQL